ncbi:hypothetical protein J6590_005378 [Homalodisca vitripennis]|nr:hypothetical protein J6590_005378 [Homalodisca vitripennis]
MGSGHIWNETDSKLVSRAVFYAMALCKVYMQHRIPHLFINKVPDCPKENTARDVRPVMLAGVQLNCKGSGLPRSFIDCTSTYHGIV